MREMIQASEKGRIENREKLGTKKQRRRSSIRNRNSAYKSVTTLAKGSPFITLAGSETSRESIPLRFFGTETGRNRSPIMVRRGKERKKEPLRGDRIEIAFYEKERKGEKGTRQGNVKPTKERGCNTTRALYHVHLTSTTGALYHLVWPTLLSSLGAAGKKTKLAFSEFWNPLLG